MTMHLAWSTALLFVSNDIDRGGEVDLGQRPARGPVLGSESVCEAGDQVALNCCVAHPSLDIQEHSDAQGGFRGHEVGERAKRGSAWYNS
jgi:hypothetical protein